MMEEGASNPFSLFDRLYEAGQKMGKQSDSGVGIDRLQVVQMDGFRAKAKAKGYTPGAKPRARSRPKGGRIVRGYMENPETDNR